MQDDGYEADLPEHVPSSIAALTPAPRFPKPVADEPQAEVEAEEPEVVAQQRHIAESFPPEPEAEPEPVHVAAQVVSLPKRQALPVVQAGRKAAFTLRLDAERHLRLRLATAVTGRSAQLLVIGALDALLSSIPELEALAERVPPAKAKRS
jgi:hypothetical protein